MKEDPINNEETFEELRQLVIIFCKQGILPEDQLQQMLRVAEENKLYKAVAYFKVVLRLQEESNGDKIKS